MKSERARHILRLLLLAALLLPVTFRSEAKEFVIVIDAGHGGKDGGALGHSSNEKTINLTVAKKLASLIKKDMKDARTVLTRDKDNFVTLQGRADIANRAGADIFISIHANSVDKKNKNRANIHGASVYTLGLKKSDTNLAVAMRENSVMKLETDYSTTYHGFDPSSAESYIMFEMMQHNNLDQSITLAEDIQRQLVKTASRKNNGVRQAPFWVLVSTGMPAVLVELDFISNPEAEKFMTSESGSSALAKAIFNGIRQYRGNTVKSDTSAESPKAAEQAQPESEEPAADAPIIFKIQFLSSPRELSASDSRLKGIDRVEHYRDGKVVKYTSGAFLTQKEASKELPKIKKKYPDAFIIKTRDGKRIK